MSRAGQSKVADQRQDARRGHTGLNSLPSDQIDGAAKENPDDPIAQRRRILLIRISNPTARAACEQRRRRGFNAFRSACAQSGCLRLTGRIGGLVAPQHARGECRGCVAGFRNLDRPQGARDPDKVYGVLNSLVAKEFRPCANWGVREIIGRTGACRVPTSFRLSSVVPNEWIP